MTDPIRVDVNITDDAEMLAEINALADKLVEQGYAERGVLDEESGEYLYSITLEGMKAGIALIGLMPPDAAISTALSAMQMPRYNADGELQGSNDANGD